MQPGDMNPSHSPLELSIAMPCLNEAKTLPACIQEASRFLQENGIRGEIIVGDNGSSDGSQEVARRHGAEVVDIPRRGYGAALQGCIERARGKYIIMGDSDESYDFSQLMPFLSQLREGKEVVVGNRFKGGIAPGAMPFLHRYLGNPLLSAFARLVFRAPVGDVYCGLRGFSKAAAIRMDLQSLGMEFALEMIVKATLMGMSIGETPIVLHPDGRGRPPHLKTWVDGRRSLSFFLFCSPRLLFLYPGITLVLAGMSIGGALWSGWLSFGSAAHDTLVALLCSGAVHVGFQAVFFSILAKTLAIGSRLLPNDPAWDGFLRRARLEFGVLLGGALMLLGTYGSYRALGSPIEGYGDSAGFSMGSQSIIPPVFLLGLGAQVVFSAFCLSLLKFGYRKSFQSDRQQLNDVGTFGSTTSQITPICLSTAGSLSSGKPSFEGGNPLSGP